MRGATKVERAEDDEDSGLSPHARSYLSALSQLKAKVRTIPACAELPSD